MRDTNTATENKIKNGMGQFEMGPRSFKHLFDAYAKLHSWKFMGNSTVYFTSKFIHTNSYVKSVRMGNVAPYLLFQSTIPPFSKAEKIESLIKGIDNVNVNIHHFGGELNDNAEMAAISDFWKLYQFNISTLETIACIDAAVPGGGILEESGLPLPSSSHPLTEYGSKNQITFVSSMNPIPFFNSKIRLVRIKSLLHRELIAEISVPELPYMHSFAMSRRYAVLFGQPMYINLVTMLLTAEPVKCLEWHPDKPTVLYVVNLKTGEVSNLLTKAIFMLHHVNSYEIKEDRIIVDAVTYPNLNFIISMELNSFLDPNKRKSVVVDPTLKRFVLNLKTKHVSVHDFPLTAGVEGAATMDMPVINEGFRFRHYCYVWGVALRADMVNLPTAALVKRDLCQNGRDKVWRYSGHYPTEPWFVPRPGSSREDDGLLLSVILDGHQRKSYIGMFNAQTMIQVNKGYMPTHIPFTLHGRFYSGYPKRGD